MLRGGIPGLSHAYEGAIGRLWSDTTGVRPLAFLGIAVGFLDVVTTAEHMLVAPMSDGNPLLMGVGHVSPELAYGAFVGWFLLVAGIAATRDDGFGYGAQAYLFAGFGLGGVANTAYFLFGTTVFKDLVGQFPTLANLYILVLAPLGSLLVGLCWARLR